MRFFRTAAVLAAALVISALAASAAFAQPGGPPPPPPSAPPGYYAPPPPPPIYGPDPYARRGLMAGVSFGVGDVAGEEGSIECSNCEYNPLAASGELHIGYLINPRWAVMFEWVVTGKSLEASGTETLVQYAAFAAGQWWISRRFWLKSGIGGAHLSLHIDDGVFADEKSVASGIAFLGGLGYELVSASRFAVDVQLRFTSAAYQSGLGESLWTGAAGIGLNWY